MHSSTRAAPGTLIGGRYALRTAVGHGGMGTVWRAADTVLRREVAVKEVVLPPGLAGSDAEAMYERTFREARAAAALSHPSVVQVFDVVTEEGRPWIVMELLDARSLADMVIEDGPLAPRAVAKIGIALLGALEVAHAAGVLHRDVKPANVLVTRDGRCVLTDFGVAKLPADIQLTTPGMVLGSPHFISPERALGHRFGPPSDLFSLGVTLYTAVEGRPPFDKGDPLATMHSVVEDPPLPPQRCGPLVDVLYGLMEKDPTRRWDVGSARGFLREMLAGPLAQNPGPQHITDPWAVVAPAPVPPPVYDNRPTGQIGGRAMLHTGETPTHRRSRHATNAMPVTQAKASRKAGQLRLAITAGVLLVLAAATVSWAVLGRDRTPKSQPPTQPPASPTLAPLSTQSISFGGVTVKVPGTWRQTTPEGTYVDIEEPTDPDRWLRLNNTGETNARNALQSGENNILKKFCDGGYQRLSLGDAELGGAKGAQLEFTCTPKGKPQRHGIWRMAVVGGKMRHLYLQTWESTFLKDKAVFDAALASFQVGSP
jgi:eukaryotic-like serine/threonine-protein kinase